MMEKEENWRKKREREGEREGGRCRETDRVWVSGLHFKSSVLTL